MKKLAALCLLGSFAVLGTWLAHAQTEPEWAPRMATLTQKKVTEPVKDEKGNPKLDDFGDPVIETRWEDTFKLGLDYAGPAMGGLGGLAVVLFFLGRRKDKMAA